MDDMHNNTSIRPSVLPPVSKILEKKDEASYVRACVATDVIRTVSERASDNPSRP